MRDQERTWWFIGVCLITLIYLPITLIGVWLQQSAHVDKMADPWFAAGFALWIGLGVSALMFLLCIFLPTRPPQNRGEWFFASIIGSLWGLTIPGSMMIMMQMPNSIAKMKPWQEWLAILVPVFIVISYFAAPLMAQRRLRPRLQTSDIDHTLTLPPHQLTGSTGLRLLIITLFARIFGFLLLVSTAMAVTYHLMSGTAAAHFPQQAAMQVFIYAIIFSAILPDMFSLRMLRTMPLSTRQLSLTLLSVPTLTGMLTSLLLVMTGNLDTLGYSPWQDGLAIGLFSAGLGSAVLTYMCHVTSNWRFAVFALPAMIMPLQLLEKTDLHVYLLPIGLTLLVSSYLLMQRGFWRSSAFYRKRQNYGMNVGQPFGSS
ncbi:MAG: hypothetical protein OJI67_08510 [Prosthecobacter sp.]|nr:hypothetical protein [Prosthecobacter sp.]